MKVGYLFASRLRFGSDRVATVGHAWYVWDQKHEGQPRFGTNWVGSFHHERPKKPHGEPAKKLIPVGYAWYKEDQWDRLHEVCPDSEDFSDSFHEWLEFANQRCEQLTEEVQGRGMKLVKVIIDVDELLEWCQRNHQEPNGQARSHFVAEKVSHQANDE